MYESRASLHERCPFSTTLSPHVHVVSTYAHTHNTPTIFEKEMSAGNASEKESRAFNVQERVLYILEDQL